MAEVTEKPVEEVPTAEKEAIVEAVAPAAEATNEDSAAILKKEKQIIRQLEYYFSDANLGRDKFLIAKIAEDEAGWVPLSVMVTFKRLAELSTDFEEILKALEKSDEGLLEISEDRQKIRRHPERPVPEPNEEVRKELESRTLYVKGFLLESTMDELINFFSAFDKVVHIQMRKYLDKPTKTYKFKGSVFAQFEKKEQAEEFIGKTDHKVGDRPLLVKWQAEYLKEKREAAQEAIQKRKKAAAEIAEKNKIVLPKGAVLHFAGVEDEEVTREVLREAVESLGGSELAYVDFSKRDKEGYFRFQEENAAVKFAEKLQDNKLKVKELELVCRVIAEKEEEEYLEKTVGAMKNRRNNYNNKSNRNGGGFGNRKRKYGGGRNDHKKKKEA